MFCRSTTIAALLTASTATADPLPALTRINDPSVFAIARKAIEAERLSKIHLIEDQSFDVISGRISLMSLVSGQAVPTGGGREGLRCVAVLVTPEKQSHVVQTIGAGDWEAETCTAVRAVGTLGQPTPDSTKIALMYEARSPNSDTLEPVVLAISNGRLTVDASASRKASLAGATTVRAIRNALGP